MNLLITNVKWDTEGETLEECRLPNTVVMLDAPGNPDEETISTTLSDAFGFCHDGFKWERLNPAHDTHAGGGFFPDRLAIARYPQ
jgi:hypothetical protein